ncbi:S49 family peptidase [Babesia caballi]|uniref:S49 family peptidase n=1 Tax=Babesia caballi TaxID=5871 RepID=A0AAV4LXA9_BABCB|nr:S49 family peptidase [Babesia caballi]
MSPGVGPPTLAADLAASVDDLLSDLPFNVACDAFVLEFDIAPAELLGVGARGTRPALRRQPSGAGPVGAAADLEHHLEIAVEAEGCTRLDVVGVAEEAGGVGNGELQGMGGLDVGDEHVAGLGQAFHARAHEDAADVVALAVRGAIPGVAVVGCDAGNSVGEGVDGAVAADAVAFVPVAVGRHGWYGAFGGFSSNRCHPGDIGEPIGLVALAPGVRRVFVKVEPARRLTPLAEFGQREHALGQEAGRQYGAVGQLSARGELDAHPDSHHYVVLEDGLAHGGSDGQQEALVEGEVGPLAPAAGEET